MVETGKSRQAARTEQINIQKLMVVYTIQEVFQFRPRALYVLPNQSTVGWAQITTSGSKYINK